jgi:hypothetical protein
VGQGRSFPKNRNGPGSSEEHDAKYFAKRQSRDLAEAQPRLESLTFRSISKRRRPRAFGWRAQLMGN